MGRLLEPGGMKRSTYLLTGLYRLHAELARELGYKDEERAAVIDKMKLVEQVIKLVEPDFKVTKIVALRKRMPNPLVVRRAQLSRHCMEVLRGAPRPLLVEEIVKIMAAERGLTEMTHEDVTRMRNSVLSWLCYNAGKMVTRHGRYPSHWTLILDD
jgi:hypothetical protein